MFDEYLLPFIANLSPTIMWIAITVGVLLFVMGYFAGGRESAGKIVMCVFIVSAVGALSLPAPIKLYSLVARKLYVETTVIGKSNVDTTGTITTPQEDSTRTEEVDTTTVTTSLKGLGSDTSKISPSTKARLQKAGKRITELSQHQNGITSNVPTSLQLLAFFLYLLWTAVLVGMGIFLYEIFTVTAREAQRH